MPTKISRQEEAYNYVTETFLKLLEQDDRIGYEFKKSVLAFWKDLFVHEGMRNNMVQAFSNFLDEVDKRMDASRKAGMMQIRDAFDKAIIGPQDDPIKRNILMFIDEQIKTEEIQEEIIPISEDIDLSEVGGGDEDNTPLL